LDAVVRDSNDAVTLLDFNGNILSWNRGAERIYGWSKEQLELERREELYRDNRPQPPVSGSLIILPEYLSK